MPTVEPVKAEFIFENGGVTSTLKVPISIPMNQSVKEFVGRLVEAHNLPCYIEKDLETQCKKFVKEKTKQYYDDNAEALIAALKAGKTDQNSVVEEWRDAFTKVAEYAKSDVVSSEQIFSDVYHSLIHSAALDTLLNLEHTYALAIGSILERKTADLLHLEERQQKEMEEAVKCLGVNYTDEQVNQLALRHFEKTQLIQSKWASELSNLQDTQRREYREWVMKVHEDSQNTTSSPAYMQRLQSLSLTDSGEDEEYIQPVRMEESFTIHLGAQLKTMHNLRLISADVLDLCQHKPLRVRGALVPQPQRLQTAMSLYSNSLNGLVLLVDNRLNSYTGIKRDFSAVCQQSTDFHFPNLDQQFDSIDQELIKANEWHSQQRKACSEENGDKISIRSSGSASSDKDDKIPKMQSGDFYITRHSNLSEVHVVFHLVCDQSIMSSDLTSRHAVILGYRNILKACFRFDVYTITLPLLLAHEMAEEMTIAWCMKRAELVFKCVKGFMMELAMYSGQESRTIQFLVPKGLSDQTFQSISNMLPSIFRMSNPVIAKSS